MGRRSSADAKWLQQVRRSGTTADRVAAMSVLLQDGAVANLPSLDGLLAMVSKKGGARAVVGSAMDALKELFTTVLLPNRKLRFFEQQPLDKVEAGREGERRLLYWLVEDGVKKRYATYVDALEACSRDNLEYVKDRAVKALFELLSAKPEQEARLLSALVNKLGDPDRKLASKSHWKHSTKAVSCIPPAIPYFLKLYLLTHRPGLQERARYYAVVYLNQMVLNHKQQAQAAAGGSLARRLIDVYFTVFKMVLDGKIGTAAQLAKAQADKAAEAAAKRKKGEAAKARAAEEARQKAAAAAAATGQQGSGEMDSRMLSALITGVRRAFPYVPADEVEPLIEAHADALFRLVHARSFGVATQALLLLFQLMSSRSTVSDRFYRALYAVLGSPELYRSTKSPMFLSLLFKAIKADVSAKRTAAFAKRMLQVAQESPAHFACGCLLLTSELLKERGGQLKRLAGSGSSSEEEEEEGSDSEGEQDLMPGLRQQQAAAAAAAAQRAAKQAAEAADAQRWPASKEAYDLHKREPQFSNADRSCLWELTSLAAHVHPSVAAMARTLLAGQNVLYDGDPLRDLTLGAFLEKFVQKKAKAGAKGDSAMQPLAARPDASAGPQQWAALAGAQADALAALAEKDVRPDDMFFHKYYSLQAVQDKAKAKKKKKGEGEDELLSDAESEDSDAADDFLVGEEEGGDDGIGADPGKLLGLCTAEYRSGMDYDYADLAAAMDSGDDSDAAGASDSELDASEDEEAGGRFGSKFAAAAGENSGSEDEAAGGGSSSDWDSDGDAEEPAGATFSDMSDSEDEECGPGSGPGGRGGPGSDSELSGSDGGSGSEGEGDDSSDDGFEAELAAEDFSEDEDEDGSGSSGSEEDDAAADAEQPTSDVPVRVHQVPAPAPAPHSRHPPPPLPTAAATAPSCRSGGEMLLGVYIGLGAFLACLLPGCMCFFNARRYAAERDARVRDLEAQAARAAAAAERGDAPPPPPPRPAPTSQPRLSRDSLRAPLLDTISEDASDAGAQQPVQAWDELPACVKTFLSKAVRDGRRFKMFTLLQTGRMKLDPKGGWKHTNAVQRACALEPAFVWTATASLAPLVTVKGCDSLVNGSGYCSWQLWGSVAAAAGGGPEVEQSLRVRWLAEAPCFPPALQPSLFLRWEEVKGEPQQAQAVLSWGGPPVRATFTFDRWGRVARCSSHDFLRRLPDGSFEQGEWQVAYSGHMLFGLSPQGPVMQEEIATHAGVFVPTNVEAAWVMPDSSRWVYAQMTVSKVTASI
ncbi:hypothetical protein COHA_004873 [Chlorella ohadii]|uniref:CCAAT-binding factor domain-containing protein n=1 Tax=Chlorella ohadii TaxID=2649997 RepID=A0AAD5DS89_9CHLO|nr:hypothetical protein COHA_004873 [Chlorella ohadii]